MIKFGIVMTGLLQICGCGKADPAAGIPEDDRFKGIYVISAEEAVEKIGTEEVQFVDARGSQPALLGTVEGAVATTWKELSTCQEGNPGEEQWGLVPEPEELEERLSNLGLDKKKQIIVIGDPGDGWGEDGRVAWELLQAGFRDIRIVDGGIDALKAADAKMQFGGSSPEKTEVRIDELDQSNNIMTEELLEKYDTYKIVDVRTVEEYEGAILHGEAQGGHLPGAVNVPFVDFFTEGGVLKSNEEISAMLEEQGIEKTDEIVVYCTGGIRSGYSQLVLEMCGYTHVYNYGQSFWRWAVIGEVES